jgi:hypothetical protein
VESAKYQGYTFTSDLLWNDYVNNICNKANRTIGFLKRNLSIGYTTVKQNAYNAFVGPLVGYAIPVWDVSRQLFGIVTFSLVILYIIVSLASFLLCSKDFHSRCSSIWFTLDLLLWLLVTHLTISRENNTIPTSYKLHGHTLKTVESAKYLDCTFTSDLRWNDYVNNICNKANRTIGFLKRNYIYIWKLLSCMFLDSCLE